MSFCAGPSKDEVVFTREQALGLLASLTMLGGLDRVVHLLTDITMYRADPAFWGAFFAALPPEAITLQSDVDQYMARVREAFLQTPH